MNGDIVSADVELEADTGRMEYHGEIETGAMVGVGFVAVAME